MHTQNNHDHFNAFLQILTMQKRMVNKGCANPIFIGYKKHLNAYKNNRDKALKFYKN